MKPSRAPSGNDGPTLWDLLAASVTNAVNAMMRPSQPRAKPLAPPQNDARVKPVAKPAANRTIARKPARPAPRADARTHPAAIATLAPGHVVEAKPIGKANPKARVKASLKVNKLSPARKRPTMQDRYDAVTRELLAEHSIRVRKWRTSMSGVAWELRYRDGTRSRLIECPKPKSPMSLAIFLHEVGHHVIGLGVYRPRCLEEYHAWRFALDQMAARGFPITDRVERRYQRSMHYAVAKATRRGIKSLPDEVQAFTGPMPK